MRKIGVLLLIFMLFLSLILIFTPNGICSVGGKTIDVYAGESIQDAINSANYSGGDTVYIHSGNYQITSTIIIDRPLSLIGEGSGTVTIKNSNSHTIKVTANDVTISDLTIKNSGQSYQCILLDYVSDCTISYNIIEDGASGINLVASNSNTIEDNYFNNNINGIWSLNSDSNTIKLNSFQNSNSYGIHLDSSSNGNTIYKNDFNDMVDGRLANARDDGSNYWDDGISKGNYWDDYNDYEKDPPNPYNISGNGGNQDNYPLGDFLTSSQDPIAYIDSITPNPATQGEMVNFVGHGTDDGTIINWEWKSSIQGVLASSKNYQSSSLSTGTHTISYRVMDNDAIWSDYDYKTLKINQPNEIPRAYILDPTSQVTKKYGESIEFIGDGSDDGQIVEYFWHSSVDGFLTKAVQFTKSDLSVGEHTIYLKVRDNNGEWSPEASLTVIILSETSNNAPIPVSGGPYFASKDNSVTFDASESYDPDESDSIESYEWDFGDGTSGEGATPQHTYTAEGNYTVELTVTDSYGEQRVVTTYVNVSSQPSSQDEVTDDNKDTPGFETIFIIIATILLIFLKRKKRN